MKAMLLPVERRTRRILRGLAAASAITLALAQPASAQWGTLESNLHTIICGLYEVFKGIIGPLAVLVFAIAGVQWIASRDDPGKRKQAQDAMVIVIVGVLMLTLVNVLIGGVGSSLNIAGSGC